MPRSSASSEMPPASTLDTPGLRIDGAHAVSRNAARATSGEPDFTPAEADEAEAVISAFLEPTPSEAEERLHEQAGELAAHLRDRLRAVDRREARLNAQVAELENDLRQTRLWIREREFAFQQREADLCRQIEDLQHRGELVAQREASTASLDDREAAVLTREQQCDLGEIELRQRRNQLDREAAGLAHAQQLWEMQRNHAQETLDEELASARTQLEAELALRREQVQYDETRLGQERSTLAAERADFEKAREEFRRRSEERERTAREQAAQENADLNRRQAEVQHREGIVQQQREALDQLRLEVMQVHRQSLEMRLIAEQLWAQLTGRLGTAELTHSIASLRVQLSRQYELEQTTLTRQREDLLAIIERIKAEQLELLAQRQELRVWGAARQAGIEEQAKQLVEREQALETEQEDLRTARQQLHQERRSYQEQIRELTQQLRARAA